MASKREALISSAEKSLQKGKVDAALKDYLKVLEETPNDINVLNKVGDLNVRLGKNEDSIPFFLRIAEHYARDGFYVRGIAMYKKINKLDPARLDIYEKLAELYVKQQLWMEAKSNYQVLADYLLKQDDLQGAIGIYQKMVAIDPQNLQLHVRLADLFTQAKRIPEALREYAVVAAALSERGAHEESIRVYEKALKLAPDNLDILRTLVPLLLSINSTDQARAVLRKGLEASPRSVPLFLLAADAAVAANDMAEARSYSEKARAVEPENEEVLVAAVRIQLKGRRPDLAWAAAAPLAEAAVRRGETKKALGILVPIARAAPDSDDLIRKIVDIAAGAGDEVTALPFRSALAELYRKKGKLAEAADLLRHCSRVQPDNAEFRARLAQLEPQVVSPAAAPRIPPMSIERNLEVSVSGLEVQKPRAPAPEPAPPPEPPPPAPPSLPAQEFEFDLDDAEMSESSHVSRPAPSPAPPPTPPRGLPAPPPAETFVSDQAEPIWSSLTAAEALEEFEAREAEAAREARGEAPGAIEEIEELRPEAELPAAPPSFDHSFAPPKGIGDEPPGGATGFAIPSFESTALPEPSWSSALPAGLDSALVEEPSGPSSFGPVPRAVSEDAALEDALVESDVFRRYGLLEKAVEQLRPWLDRAPENLKVREKLFEIHLEQGHRDEARSLATNLADAYGADGREDRIRGLEALLGEPLRAAEPEAAEQPPVAGALVGEEGSYPALKFPEAGPAGEEGVERPALAFPEEPALAAQLPDAFGVGIPPFTPSVLEEPPTEIITALPSRPPSAPAPVVDLSAGVFRPEAFVETAEPTPLPAQQAAPPPAARVPREPEPVVSAAKAAPPAPARREPPARRLSAEEVLGLAKPSAATASKRVKAVTPDEVALELLGRGAKPKPKAKAPKAEANLPEDLLRTLKKPSAPQEPVSAPELLGSARGLPEAAPPPEAPFLPGADLEAISIPFTDAGRAAAGEAEELPAPFVQPSRPSEEELAELDFCLDQGMVVDAAERLQSLEGRFPGDAELEERRLRLEGGRSGAEAPRAALHDLLSDDLDSVLDAELGRALTEDMVRELPTEAPVAPVSSVGAPVLDDSGLFSDEQEFFNFADELHTELKKDNELPVAEEGRDVSLEEIFRDFKKGVEQQLSPEDFETHYNLGIAYKEMGLTDEAIGEFQLAAKDPLHAVECCAMLGICFLEKGLPQLAVKWYRKGLETIGIREPDRLGLQYALGGVLEQVGDRDGAYRIYLDIYGTNAGYQDVGDRIKALRPFATS